MAPLNTYPFDAKHPELYTDTVRGYPGTHVDLRAMLDWLVEYCRAQQLIAPFVTCFGRTRAEMEEIYLPLYLQEYGSEALARARARSRFSWHCIPKLTGGRPGLCRAMDLRYSVWTDGARARILAAAREKWPHAELLDHSVPGGGRHLHMALPDPAGKPADWL